MDAAQQGSRGGNDNRRPGPERLLGVAQPEVGEHQVRRTLTEQAGRVPQTPTDLATRAIARAGRVRRRRRVLGAAAAMIGMVAAGGALVHGLPVGQEGGGGGYTSLFSGAETPDPPPERGEAQLAADPAVTELVSTDVIGQGRAGGLVLATADGHTADLGPLRAVSSAHRLGEGWAVVGGAPGTVRLWWVGSGAEPVPTLSGMEAIAVEGARVAWRRGAMLSTAVLSPGGELEQRTDTRAPERGGEPVGFLGEAVLLRQGEAGAAASWDVWTPARGDYRPAWNKQVVRIYGAEPGGQSAIGLAAPSPAEDHPCLVRLRIEDSLVVAGRACLPDIPALGPAAVSPDGRWLVGTAAEGGSAAPVVAVDLLAAFDGDPRAASAVAGAAGAGSVSDRPVWPTADQAVLPVTGGLVRVHPGPLLAGEPEAVEVINLSGDPPVLVQGG